jgi:hypothetical protein
VKHLLVLNPLREPWKVSMNGKQHQLMNKDYECGTWNVRTLFKSPIMKSLLQQIKDYRIQMTGIV